MIKHASISVKINDKVSMTTLIDSCSSDNFISEDLGGGGNLVLFMVRGRAIFRGTFFKYLQNYGYHFHKFYTFHIIMRVLFEGFFMISRIRAHIFIRFTEL